MDNGLLNAIHRYAEDREIDYLSAKGLGEQLGFSFENETELTEWKQVIDRYLKTFNMDDFKAIEEACAVKKKKKKKI